MKILLSTPSTSAVPKTKLRSNTRPDTKKLFAETKKEIKAYYESAKPAATVKFTEAGVKLSWTATWKLPDPKEIEELNEFISNLIGFHSGGEAETEGATLVTIDPKTWTANQSNFQTF